MVNPFIIDKENFESRLLFFMHQNLKCYLKKKEFNWIFPTKESRIAW